jgi:hypothetical protein
LVLLLGRETLVLLGRVLVLVEPVLPEVPVVERTVLAVVGRLL